MTGRIRDLTTARNGKTILTLEINERAAAETLYDELNQCEKVEISVKKWRDKRSNDAIRYFWELTWKLAAKTGIPVEMIYREAVKNIGLYAGSSTYNTEQMSRLINLIVEECKTQGIETRPPDEIAAMMQYWEDRTR